MNIEERRQTILAKQKELFCEWCPNDCRDREKDKLTDEERAGCVASGGFAEESVKEMAEQDIVFLTGVHYAGYDVGVRNWEPLIAKEGGR